IVPPQESPTFHALSSATPNSSVLGLPLSITSSASVTTAPSTQPPETEPRKLPWSSITRLEPTGRGAEPQVSTTVASATPRPSLRQSSAAVRMSSSRASMGLSSLLRSDSPLLPEIWASGPFPAMMGLGRHPQPAFGIAGPRAVRRERPAQLGHGFQIVDRAELVDVGQHGA